MSYGCHRRQRAEQFRRSNYVSHVPKGRLKNEEVVRYIRKFESYFQKLAEQKARCGMGLDSNASINVRESYRDYNVQISGNCQSGSIVVQSGHSFYSEIHFSPRAIHVYRSDHEDGNLGGEAAVYLNRRLPNLSLGYGAKAHLERLVKSVE